MFSLFSSKSDVFICNADFITGFYVARGVHDSNKFNKVICGVSNLEDEFSKELERLGCELREWNLEDRTSIQRAMQGVENMVLSFYWNDKVEDQCNMMLEAIHAAQVKNVVLWSTMALEQARGKEFKQLMIAKRCEDLVAKSGIQNFCIARITTSHQSLFYLSRWIQDQGILPMATGRGKTAIVNLHDCGIATANILASSMEEHKNQMYTFTGPELMTGMKLVEHANRVLHSDIEFRDISIEEFKKMMKEIGEVSDAQIDFAAECCMLMRDNKWAIKTDHLMRCLEGRKPTDIETFFRNNADSFRPRGGMIRRLAFKDAL